MVLNRTAFNTLNIGFSAAFNKGFESVPTQYEKIATIVPSSTKEQNYAWIGRIPSMRKWVGERAIQNISAHDYIIKNDSFEVTIGVDRDDIDDDNYGVYTPMMQDLGESAKRHPNQLVFTALRKGFVQKCYDGKCFFATDHPNGEEKTYSNMSTKKLTQESYAQARAAIMQQTDENGNSLGLVPDTLVVAPENEAAALAILNADLIDGSSNIYKGTAELIVEPELSTGGSGQAWYLLCTKRSLRPIIYQERKKAVFTSLTADTDQNVFLQKQFLYGVDSRGNVGYGFPQMAFGSTGTTAG